MANYFVTADVDLAATIITTAGSPIADIDRSDPSRPKIRFNREDVIDELVQAYYRGDLRVDPLVFAMVHRFLRFKINQKK
ncbi:MAG: hypothetical protein PHU25_01220 [Deltaproteobacteria bacterium]|nr:hypothetical protein [Deltaproteobacteria bacterium]